MQSVGLLRVSRSLCLCYALISCACTSPVQDARKLADTAQLDLAVKKLEAIISDEPENTQAYVALGDVHLQAAALEADRKGGENLAKDLARKALAAYQGALKLSEEPDGLLLTKMAHASRLSGELDQIEECVLKALKCCGELAALTLLKEPKLHKDEIVAALKLKSLHFAEWKPIPSFSAIPTEERLGFIVKEQPADVLAIDKADKVGELEPFAEYRASTAQEQSLVFSYPHYTKRQGYVFASACWDKQANTCGDGPAQLVAPNDAIFTKNADYGGARIYDYRPGTAQCLKTGGGGYIHGFQNGGHTYTSQACKVEYEGADYSDRRVKMGSVYRIPTGRVLSDGSPAFAIRLAHDAGLTEIVPQLAAGNLAVGAHLPLIQWAIGEARVGKSRYSAFKVRETEIEEQFINKDGRFVLVNGALREWVQETASPGTTAKETIR